MISLQWPWVAVRNFTSYNALFVCFLANIIILDFWLKEHFYRESCIFSVLSHVSGSHFGYVDASVPFLGFRCPVSLLLYFSHSCSHGSYPLHLAAHLTPICAGCLSLHQYAGKKEKAQCSNDLQSLTKCWNNISHTPRITKENLISRGNSSHLTNWFKQKTHCQGQTKNTVR